MIKFPKTSTKGEGWKAIHDELRHMLPECSNYERLGDIIDQYFSHKKNNFSQFQSLPSDKQKSFVKNLINDARIKWKAGESPEGDKTNSPHILINNTINIEITNEQKINITNLLNELKKDTPDKTKIVDYIKAIAPILNSLLPNSL